MHENICVALSDPGSVVYAMTARAALKSGLKANKTYQATYWVNINIDYASNVGVVVVAIVAQNNESILVRSEPRHHT